MFCRVLFVLAAVGPLALGVRATTYSQSAQVTANKSDVPGASEEPPPQSTALPTGKFITPTAARGAIFQELNPALPNAPDVRVSGAAAVAASPNGRWLAIETSGYNRFYDRNGKTSPELSTDYLFLFDIAGAQPKPLQVVPLHATFQGLSWAPSSDRLFVSGGVDDAVVELARTDSTFSVARTLRLEHRSWVGPDLEAWAGPAAKGCVGCSGEVSGIAVSPDGKWLLIANIMNDSVSLIDRATGRMMGEQDLRPGIIDPKRHGQPGGSYPRAVAWSSVSRAYVASERDREIISLGLSHGKIRLVRRIPVRGAPVALIANHSGSRLYVALDTTGQVVVVDTLHDRVIESLEVVAPESLYANKKLLGGANTNALALTPDERTLLVTNGGENALAVVQLSNNARGAPLKRGDGEGDDDDRHDDSHSAVVGLIPTGWYPAGVATSQDGSRWYVVNGKSPAGPNAGVCKRIDPVLKICVTENGERGSGQLFAGGLFAENLQVEQLEKAGFLTLPAPSPLELASLTQQVARNNRFDQPEKTPGDERLFSFLHDRIKHVIYIMKENRSYDQVLGDLEVGNGDSRLTYFPEKITPNQHAIARGFVTLDNTLVSGEGSMQGWTWTESAQTTDYNERNEPLSYVGRAPIDVYGNDRSLNMGLATSKDRHQEWAASPSDPDILPGTRDVMAPDGPGELKGKGYIWDAALQKGLTVRNYGMAPNPTWALGILYKRGDVVTTPGIREPYKHNLRVFWTSKASLMPYSDPYYLTFYPSYPDFWRVKEWKREFAGFVAQGSAPNLTVMWLANDHMGYFEKAIDGVNTPETMVADNDYALGEIVEAVANSPFAKDTLIISIEDDAWDGADHVDAHRSVVLFAGPYVRRHAVVSTRYTTVSVVKTIEAVLGLDPIGLNDALAAPMSDLFDPTAASWSYKAVVPDVLRSTRLPLPAAEHADAAYPRHSAAYWAKAMAGQDFSGPDRVDPVSFNRALWCGFKADEPYPSRASDQAPR